MNFTVWNPESRLCLDQSIIALEHLPCGPLPGPQCVRITNCGNDTLHWSYTYSTPYDIVWPGFPCSGCEGHYSVNMTLPPGGFECIRVWYDLVDPPPGHNYAYVYFSNLDDPSDVATLTIDYYEWPDPPEGISVCRQDDTCCDAWVEGSCDLPVSIVGVEGAALPDTQYLAIYQILGQEPIQWSASFDTSGGWLGYEVINSNPNQKEVLNQNQVKLWIKDDQTYLPDTTYEAQGSVACLNCYSCELEGRTSAVVNIALRFLLVSSHGAYVDCANGNDNNAGTYFYPFQTIAKGIASVDAGDTVFVLPSTCSESVIIDKQLALIGLEGSEQNIILAPPNTRCVLVDSVLDTVTVRGFTLTGGNPVDPPSSYLVNQGGGLLAVASQVNIVDCRIEGNHSTSSGGGVSLRNGTAFRISNSIICHNSSGNSGGGIVTVDAQGGTIDRTAIVGNNSVMNGGGIFFYANQPAIGRDFVMTNTVVTNNICGFQGAGIETRRTDLDLRNTIVSNNVGSGVGPFYGAFASYSQLVGDYNDFYQNAGGNNYNDSVVVGIHNVSSNPLFLGDTACVNFSLDPCSPCIDAGDPSIPPLVPNGGLRSDMGVEDRVRGDCQDSVIWQVTIHALGQVIGSAVNRSDVVVGVGATADSLYQSPEPPEYTVFTKLWRQTWGGPFYRDIRQTGQSAYFWILQVDPHGNMPPPSSRCADLTWNPDSLTGPGFYLLRADSNADGIGESTVVEDMKTTSSYQVCGTGLKYFVITYRTFLCGDVDGEGTINIADAVYLINYIFGGGPAPSPYAAGDVDCSGDINIADAVYLVYYIFADGPVPCAACK